MNTVMVPTLFYAGPKDGLAPGQMPAPGPESVECLGGRYVRLEEMPGWMSFLPTRSIDTVIYLWEDAYVV